MAVRGQNRQFPTAYKLKAIRRVERGEGVLPVARELGIARKLLHEWIKAWKAHRPDGLNRKPGHKPGPRKLRPLAVYDDKRSALAQAKARMPSSNGWSAGSRWTSIFFGKPCAHWGGRQRKANPRPHRRSHQSHDGGDNRFQRRRTTSVPSRWPAARSCTGGRRRHSAGPVRNRFPGVADLLTGEPQADLFDASRSAESIGRPLRDDRFLTASSSRPSGF